MRSVANAKVPLHPTPQEILDAATLVTGLLKDFDFEDGVSWLAGFGSTFIAGVRGSLPTAPIFAALAHRRGQSSGKSTLTEMLIAIATGEDPNLYKITLEGSTEDTNRTAFRSLRDKPMALIVSNIDLDHIFRSAKLAELSTSGHIEGSVHYSMHLGKLQCRPFVAFNGNAVRLHSDFGGAILAC